MGSAEWCEAEHLLCSLYSLKHNPSSSLQSAADVSGVCGVFTSFVVHLESQAAKKGAGACVIWPALSSSDLQILKQAVSFVSSAASVAWFPEYGCSLLAMRPLEVHFQPSPDAVSVSLVGLDEWHFSSPMHSTAQGKVHHSSRCGSSVMMPCGTVPAEGYLKFLQTLHRLIARAQQRKGDHRSAGTGSQGHQKTPAFVHALVLQALEEQRSGEQIDCQPRGAFTDVGRHTGGQARDTPWPLVCETIRAVLSYVDGMRSSTPELFQQLVAHLHLWLLQRQVQLIRPATATSMALTAAVQMLQTAAYAAKELAEAGHTVQHFLAACHSAREALEAAAAERAQQAAKAFSLDGAVASLCSPGSYRLPQAVIPLPSAARHEVAGLAEAKQRAALNLGSLPLSAEQPGRLEIGALLALLQSAKLQSSGDVAAQHALCTAERELFLRAARGFDTEAALGQQQVDALADVVDAYRMVLYGFLSSSSSAARMRVELYSREALVGWVAYCMMHAASCRKHPILKEYGVGLCSQYLHHLVLSDRTATEALLAVAAYLDRHTVPKSAVFTLEDGGQATFQLAEVYSRQDSQMSKCWKGEQAAAEVRRQEHWQEVQRKQRLAAGLRNQLAREQAAVETAKAELSRAEVSYNYQRHRRPHYGYAELQLKNNAEQDLSAAKNRLECTRTELKDALASPAPVIQPLPMDSALAHCWIFFLYMPPMLRQLGRMSFLAQQLILPRPPPMEVVGTAAPRAFLVDHYNLHQQSTYLSDTGRRGSSGTLWFVSAQAAPPPNKVKLPDIDSYTSSTDGVWHPDGLLSRLGWQGTGCKADCCSFWFNPFARLEHIMMVEAFTEQLPSRAGKLQWVMPQCGSGAATPPERGNLGIALQDLCPEWLSKPGFLAFCALRSYPLTQMRKLCVALQERSLPLGHPAVQTLVRQTLYHCGVLAGGPPPALLWRTDWDAGDMLSTLCRELSLLAEELANAPREHMAALLLGEMAAYLSAWHEPLQQVARAFADMAMQWAEALEPNVRDAVPAVAQPLRAKQCLLRMIALNCYGSGEELDATDARGILGLSVRVRHDYVHGQGTPLQGQLAQLQVLCHWALARRAPEIVHAAKRQPSILTEALDLVLKQREPTMLDWRQICLSETKQDSASFQAEDGKHLYSINCLDGTVLLDGRPPGRLPKEILGHPLYQRCFGDWEFEVSLTSREVHETISPVNGRFYEFSLDPDGDLVVMEREGELCLQLLDVGSDHRCGDWGNELPLRLRELHSHWMSREKRAIVLRPPHFRAHSVNFILQWEGGPAGGKVELVCLRVPPHLQAKGWVYLLSQRGVALTDQLVLHTSRVTEVLSKFERQEYIHTYVNASAFHSSDPPSTGSSSSRLGSSSEGWDALSAARVPRDMLFVLPRFGLEFELRADALASLDYNGYCLHPSQQLVEVGGPGSGSAVSYTLPDFKQYLVLQQVQKGSRRRRTCQPGGQVKVLVPLGEVQRVKAEVAVVHCSSSDTALKVHCYDMHPRFHYLRCNSILGRLQLAALYAACSSLLPEPRSQKTGAQMAMELLRKSWGVKPLGLAELQQLQATARLGGHLAAGLPLLAYEIHASASQLNCLHFPDGAPAHATPPACDSDWGLAYLREGGRHGYHNPRLLLTPGEEQRALGMLRAGHGPPLWKRLHQYQEVEVPDCPVAASVVSSTEASLIRLVVDSASGQSAERDGGAAPYPLHIADGCLRLEWEMHAELQDSWAVHHGMAARLGLAPGAQEWILEAQEEVHMQRERMEAYLRAQLSWIHDSVGMHGTGFRLLQASAAAPLPGLLDFMRLALQPQVALEFNPFLSRAAEAQLQHSARTWLQLCVLEDRLERLVRLVRQPSQMAALVQELQVQRVWSVDEHPEWLAFEAEGQLQIRPNQHWVANHLISHPGSSTDPGSIVQLNMGEGKTRVILPMLILHWANGDKLVRLTVLPQLLDEAYAHLHACLCASMLGRKLFMQPFHRDVRVTPQVAKAMRSALTYCKQEGGVLLTAPEHRLSLLLKRQELYELKQHDLCSALDALADQPIVDLLDESDELLSHRYQLIYAWGTQTKLPSEQARARAIQSLLHVLSHGHEHRCIAAILGKEGVAVWAPPSGKPGAFRGLRLLPGEALQAVLPSLRWHLVEAVMDDPPYHLRWMRDHPKKESLLECIVDPTVDASAVLDLLGEEEGCDVLALRGLLACGVLDHCLKLRHMVDYGVNRSSSARKRLAVPFRAAHVPAERNEYAQPDIALTLTILSYYNDGLSKQELLDMLRVLLRLGQNAQKAFYSEWWQLLVNSPQVASGDIPQGELEALNATSKLDTTNGQQMELMHRLFSNNMGAVNFFLNNCVFPTETRQFPQRLVGNAWHLADNPSGHVVGFSGTNDNHRLLPLQVRQHLEVERTLRATNGKMLAVLLDNPKYDTLVPQDDEPVWKALLNFAVIEGFDALVDCGALMVGTSIREAAKFLLTLLDSTRFKGVCYFDEKDGVWAVCDLQGRRVPRSSSAIQESQAFTIFDEARCRGADLQLRIDAVGLLTLGPATCKDKLMQAAGRLRKLSKGQRLRIIGTAEVTTKIQRVAAAAGGWMAGSAVLTSRNVLQWVMANTVEATLRGVVEWGHQGLLFAATRGAPNHGLEPEMLELGEMYGSGRHVLGVGDVVKDQCSRRSRSGLAPSMQQLMSEIVARSEQYGAGHTVVGQGVQGEECERELEREEEEEEEVERQVARVEAVAERDWAYDKALGAASVQELESRTSLTLLPLSGLAGELQPEGLGSLPWSTLVFATPNFARAIMKPPGGGAMNEYLRAVDALLLLPGGAVVLLSERECNALLELLWQGSNSHMRASTSRQSVPLLTSLCYACKAQPQAGGSPAAGLQLAVALHGGDWVALGQLEMQLQMGKFMEELVSLQLFNGETTFVETGKPGMQWEGLFSQGQLHHLHSMMRGHSALAEALVGMRGKQMLYQRSQLDLACDARPASFHSST